MTVTLVLLANELAPVWTDSTDSHKLNAQSKQLNRLDVHRWREWHWQIDVLCMRLRRLGHTPSTDATAVSGDCVIQHWNETLYFSAHHFTQIAHRFAAIERQPASISVVSLFRRRTPSRRACCSTCSWRSINLVFRKGADAAETLYRRFDRLKHSMLIKRTNQPSWRSWQFESINIKV